MKFLKDSLVRNALFITVSVFLGSGVGLLFWMLAAHLSSDADVGYISGVVSSVTLIIAISRLGTSEVLIRRYDSSNRNDLFTTTLLVSTIAALILSAIYLLFIGFFSPSLTVISSHWVLFLMMVFFTSIMIVSNYAFIAERYGSYTIYQNIINSLRLPLLLLLASMGLLGLLWSVNIALAITALGSLLMLYHLGVRPGRFRKDIVMQDISYSGANYVNSLIAIIPVTVVNIMVLGILGPEQSAYYFLAISFAMVPYSIISSTKSSMFSESSRDETLLERNLIKSTKLVLLSLIPLSVALILISPLVLNLLGSGYSENAQILFILLIVSQLLFVPISFCSTICMITRANTHLLIIGIIQIVSLLFLILIMTPIYGLEGVGFAYIISYLVTIAYIAIGTNLFSYYFPEKKSYP